MSSGQCSSTSRTIRLRNASASVHVVVEFEERHLRLDHPELGQVPRRVRVLGAERRAERVDLAERAGVDFAFELPADGEIRRLAEEVLRVVDLAVGVRGGLSGSSVRDAEHLAGPFAVAGGDDRRVDVEEAFAPGRSRGSSGRRSCAPAATAPNVFVRGRRWAIVAEQLERVPLLLQRIRLGIGRSRGRSTSSACDFGRLPLAAARLSPRRRPSRCSRRARCLTSLS